MRDLQTQIALRTDPFSKLKAGVVAGDEVLAHQR